MKFSASFAVLAVFVAKAAVSASSTPAYDSMLEARAEFVESALEEVWARFYDELLEDVDARDYDEEDIFERSPMKKFAGELLREGAQLAPGMAQQYSQGKESKARNSVPRMAAVAQQAQAKAKPAAVRPPSIPASSKWNTVKKPSVMAEIKKSGTAFGKKRSLEYLEERDFDDEEIFERSPMKKFAGELLREGAQIAPGMAQQYSQSKESKARNSMPRMAGVVQQAQAKAKPAAVRPPSIPASSKWNTVKKPSVMAEIKKSGTAFGKKRSLEYLEDRDFDDEEIFERSPMKKFAGELLREGAQIAPGMAQQYTQSQESKARNSVPRMAGVVQKAQAQAGKAPAARPAAVKPLPANSKWNTVKKPSVMAEIKKQGSIANQAKGAFGKKRSLEAFEDDLW